MKQYDLFDLNRGKELKEQGIAVAARSKDAMLQFARGIARGLALQHPDRLCSIDDVQRALLKLDIDLGMAAGAVFRDRSLWKFAGYKKTERASSHARNVSVWRLK